MTFESPIDAIDGKSYSEYELRKNIEHVILAAGGVKVAEGKIPREATNNEPTTTYVIRRADHDIWVHLVTNSAMGSWMILATTPFAATATQGSP